MPAHLKRSLWRIETAAILAGATGALGGLTACAEMLRNMRPEYKACKEHLLVDRAGGTRMPSDAVFLGEVQGADDIELVENGCAKRAHALVGLEVRDHFYVGKGVWGPLLVARAVRFRTAPAWVPAEAPAESDREPTSPAAETISFRRQESSTRGAEAPPSIRTPLEPPQPQETVRGPAVPSPRRERVFIAPVHGPLPADVRAVLFDLLVVAVQRADVMDKSTAEDLQAQLEHEKLKDAVDCSSVACATELAGMLGVRYLLSSSVKKLGNTVFFTVSLIDTKEQQSRTGQGQCQDREDDYPGAVTGAVKEALGLVKHSIDAHERG